MKKKDVLEAVAATRDKLERSIAANRDLLAGDQLNEADLCLLSPGTGLKWRERHLLIGKKMKHALPKNSHILPDDLSE